GRIAAEEAVVTEEPAAPTGGIAAEVTIESPKGKDIPADLSDLIDKRLGPDLSRGDLERFYSDFVGSDAFRTSIVGWAKKKHGADSSSSRGRCCASRAPLRRHTTPSTRGSPSSSRSCRTSARGPSSRSSWKATGPWPRCGR